MTECNHLTTELQVVRGCLSGDGESARDFVNRFRQSVYQLCYRFLGNHEDCEDVMQDTFLRAFRSLHQWDQTRPLRPWLLAIASNRCKTTLAQRVTLRKRLQQQLAENSACPESQPAQRAELAEDIELCLAKLKPELRTCFILFYREQLSCAEIAERLGHPEGTIKTWLHRTRLRMAESLRCRGHH